MYSPTSTTGLTSNSASLLSPPQSPVVIFLDIDGVLYNRPDQDGVFRKVRELFPGITSPYSNSVCSIAASYFFDTKAVDNLSYLLREIEKTRAVRIVVSSNWRETRSVEELQSTFFGIHEFSRYIIDKTPEKISQEELKNHCPSKIHHDKYSPQCRAAEIHYWLSQHPEVTDYIVLDDNNDHLLKAFEKRFVQTNYSTLLTKELCEKILSEI